MTGEFIQLIYSCPEDLLFDESKGYCVDPGHAPAECLPTTTEVTTVTKPTTALSTQAWTTGKCEKLNFYLEEDWVNF